MNLVCLESCRLSQFQIKRLAALGDVTKETRMQANWGLILNFLLLIGVVVAIMHVLKTRRKMARPAVRSPSIGTVDAQNYQDDIIAVRRVNQQPVMFADASVDRPNLGVNVANESRFEHVESVLHASSHQTQDEEDSEETFWEDEHDTRFDRDDVMNVDDIDNVVEPGQNVADQYDNRRASTPLNPDSAPLMMFLLAKADRQLAGYELLQAVLSAGLRFGEGNLFHRHQHSNGQGTVMCSLAAATDKGVFDLQNIGAFTVRGLCLFMHASGNPGIDEERFDIMLDTAKTLSDDLDTHLLDDRRQPLSDASIQRYHRSLNLVDAVV